MTIVRVGATPEYSDGWDSAFSGKKAKKKTAAKKSAKTAKKKSTKAKAAKKSKKKTKK